VWVFCSLALVLPEYSLHYIEANLGNTIKQAMCEYRLFAQNIQTCSPR